MRRAAFLSSPRGRPLRNLRVDRLHHHHQTDADGETHKSRAGLFAPDPMKQTARPTKTQRRSSAAPRQQTEPVVFVQREKSSPARHTHTIECRAAPFPSPEDTHHNNHDASRPGCLGGLKEPRGEIIQSLSARLDRPLQSGRYTDTAAVPLSRARRRTADSILHLATFREQGVRGFPHESGGASLRMPCPSPSSWCMCMFGTRVLGTYATVQQGKSEQLCPKKTSKTKLSSSNIIVHQSERRSE